MNHFITLSLAALALVAASHAYEIQPRIVGGQAANSGQFPFYGFLNVRYTTPGKGTACGASLISDEWILTAAHCLEDVGKLIVSLGEYDLTKPEPENLDITVPLDGLHPHPEYDPNLNLHDIALIRLPQKVQFNKNVQPVKLPSSCVGTVGLDVIAIGHGRTSNNGGISMPLNYVQMKSIPLKNCSFSFPVFEDHDTFVCVNGENAGDARQSICTGDSGGPLITVSDNTLIGVANFLSIMGCEWGLPQGFSKVSSYLSWIEEVTGIAAPQC